MALLGIYKDLKSIQLFRTLTLLEHRIFSLKAKDPTVLKIKMAGIMRNLTRISCTELGFQKNNHQGKGRSSHKDPLLEQYTFDNFVTN